MKAAGRDLETATRGSVDRGLHPDLPRRTESGVRLTRLGILVGVLIAMLYALLGSPVSGLAFASLPFALTVITLWVPDTVPLRVVGNSMIGLTWAVGFFVSYRTGGLASPAILWCFFHPITAYLVGGRRSSAIWTLLSTAQVGFFVVMRLTDTAVGHDFSERSTAILRNATFLICILTTSLVIAGSESVRYAAQRAMDDANRTLERQRILADMHDGLGSQLLGLMIQVRAKRIDDERLLQGLGSCLDDLKLIVDSLDPADRSFAVAVAELKARMEPRCNAAGIEMTWTTEEPVPSISAEKTLQVLRSLQEMTNNAVRHSRGDALQVSLARDPSAVVPSYRVLVKDNGRGFDTTAEDAVGRGLTNLRSRAQRLGGVLEITSTSDGTAMELVFPL